jgi:hypothetical protein
MNDRKYGDAMKNHAFYRILRCCAIPALALFFNPSAVGAGTPPDQGISMIYVAANGNDSNPGTIEAPFATLERARGAVREQIETSRKPVRVMVREGTYYLDRTLEFGPGDSGTPEAPVTYEAYPGERVTISGGVRLVCAWQPYRDGIWKTEVSAAIKEKPGFDQLFVNGKRQILARYPNFDMSDPGKSGYISAMGQIPDSIVCPVTGPNDDMTFSSGPPRGFFFDPATFTKNQWAKPEEAVVHIYQSQGWGNLQWKIRTVDASRKAVWFGDGGFQIGAKWTDDPCRVDEDSRFFIENVPEELDAPGEWYFDRTEAVLYFKPEEGIDLPQALVEVPMLEQAVRFIGTQDLPVRFVALEGFRFAHTVSTFLKPYEVPSLSDWAIHRGGTVFMQGARDCVVRNCWFDQVGGNAVFMNNHNRSNIVSGCTFTGTGESAICFVGELESTVGTQRNFPFECRAINNLIHDNGVFGKQVAGVYISRAKRITASHNTIFNMPRAGICIGDGTWGGHVIEFNHIHNTCRETGDHGPFNAWGRDKYWCLSQSHLPYTTGRSHDAGLVKIDAMEPVIVRNNFFEEKSGWGLDLDDGASWYEIYNNLCVGVSMKLREGACRTVYNNIWVNGANSPCFHVGNENNHDRYFNNITVTSVAKQNSEDDLRFGMGEGYGEIYTLIAPPAKGPWLEEVDSNCFYSDLGRFVARVQYRWEKDSWRGKKKAEKYSLQAWRKLGFDKNSVFADPMFVDPANNDYRVRPESPALKIGFKNFEMGKWGLTDEFPTLWKDQQGK